MMQMTKAMIEELLEEEEIMMVLIIIKVEEKERRKQNLNIIKWEVVKRKLERREGALVVKKQKIVLEIKCVYQEEHRI